MIDEDRKERQDYTDEELLEMSFKEVAELPEKTRERHTELMMAEGQDQIEEHKQEKASTDTSGMAALADAVEQELTTEVELGDGGASIEVLVDPDLDDIREIENIRDVMDKQVADLTDEEFAAVMDTAFQVLGNVCINHSMEDWRTAAEQHDWGIHSIGHIADRIFEEVDAEAEQKKRRSAGSRRTPGRR
jgi:hypothetical protein